jgi:GNAT superfamily N-acetyltransferase
MSITIGKAGADHIGIVIMLLKALYIKLGDEAESIDFLTEPLILQILKSGKADIYLAITDAGEAVGIVTLTECQSIYAGGKYGLLDEMYVVPSLRSNGLGALLIGKVKSIGSERGWKRVDVTAPTNGWEQAVRFYEKCGFAFTGRKLKLIV